MALKENEIQLLLKKLRDRYTEYAKKFNKVWFNLEAFDDRYRMAVENRMNLEGFILAEISNFEKIREKYEKKKSEKSFSSRVDTIMEEHGARIKKYPAVYFHPRAHFEMIHFYGALSEFTLYIIPALRLVLSEAEHKTRLNSIEDRLAPLAMPSGKKYSRRILDHIMVLSRPSSRTWELDMEKDKNNFLKESAFLLHEIVDFCDGLLQLRSGDWETPLRFDRLYIEEDRKNHVIENFSGLTGYGTILKIKESAAAIIEDFRLGAFKAAR